MTDPHAQPAIPAEAPEDRPDEAPDGKTPVCPEESGENMETLEKVAVKMAHSFNDILTAMMGIQSVMRNDVKKGVVRTSHLDHLSSASHRAAQLTSDLLKFGRRRPGLKPGPVNILKFAQELRPELKQIVGEHVRVDIEGADTVFAAIGRDDLRDIFARLAANVRDFAGDESTMFIRIAPGEAEHEGKIRVTVADDGPGMKPQVQSEATRPFFTTRPEGKARGLGLSVVHGIVRDYGGSLEFGTRPPHGAEITFLLPTATPSSSTKKNTSDPMSESAKQPQTAPPQGSGETILVVEDERMVRDLVTRSLGYLGYNVIHAENGEEGLELARDHRGEIDLIFTDIVMPRMSGPEMVQRIHEENEDFPVLFTTGFTDNKRLLQNGEIREGVNLLPKPYTTRVLATRIREVLDA